MKTLIYVTYVTAVLLFSGFARASVSMPYTEVFPEHVSIKVDHVSVIDNATLELGLYGRLPNPCYQQPFASLVQDPNNSKILRLRLSSPIPTRMCPEYLQEYSQIVNLPVLVQNSEIVVENDATYVIQIEGYKFEMQATGSELLKVPGFVMF